MKSTTFRRTVPRDLDSLSACIDAAYAQYASTIDDLPSLTAELADEITRDLVWVAEVAHSVVGGLVLIQKDGFMLLANVAVHPDHRGTGVGRELLQLKCARN